MAVTVPTGFVFQQGNLDVVPGEAIRASDVAVINANGHHLYAGLALRPMLARYWRDGLLTSSTSTEVVLEVPVRFAAGRNAAGLRLMFYRTGTCSVGFTLRDAADTTDLATFGPSAGGVGASVTSLTSGITQEDCLLRVTLSVSSGSAGLRWLRVAELAHTTANLP